MKKRLLKAQLFREMNQLHFKKQSSDTSPTHGQTVHHNLINDLQRANPRKRHAKKLNSLLHAQRIRRRLNSYNFGAGLDYNFLQPRSIRGALACPEIRC
jgi:hypothetical protein